MSTESKKKPVASAVESVKDVVKSETNSATSADGEKHILSGKVVSDKMDKTVVVLIERKVKHPVYGKYISQSSRLFVHDEKNEASVGSIIKFKACRPYSRKKTWRLIEVL